MSLDNTTHWLHNTAVSCNVHVPQSLQRRNKENWLQVLQSKGLEKTDTFFPVLTAGFCNVKQLGTLLHSLDGTAVYHRCFILVSTSTVKPPLTDTLLQ